MKHTSHDGRSDSCRATAERQPVITKIRKRQRRRRRPVVRTCMAALSGWLVACVALELQLPVQGFSSSTLRQSRVPPTALATAVDPIPTTRTRTPIKQRKKSYTNNNHNNLRQNGRRRPPKKKDQKDPAVVEAAVQAALDVLRASAAPGASTTPSQPPPPQQALLFPTVRECNAALSAFGDRGDLLRALRLFGKMRKAAYLQQSIHRQSGIWWPVPAPTLVTYSTLMSRAVRAQKPHVALRLWKMRPATLQPDVKAINILMNCYAKLGNVAMARQVLNEMQPEPNLVTFNTVLNACQTAGDLDAALEIKDLMLDGTWSLRPDARTYTTLLATVAQKPSRAAGQRDPTVALQLLQEMFQRGIAPNGRTYSAFIEACGRCGRSDLALQGLRLLQRQKERDRTRTGGDDVVLLDEEVGAWTSAIHVCGKAGRWETAVRLFRSMKKLGCAPNTVTCGCLMDSLLRCGRTAETLSVLRYMKNEGIRPTEVMYTSLMTRADRLVQMEQNAWHASAVTEPTASATRQDDTGEVAEESETKAIEVYTELMMSLMEVEGRTSGSRPSSNRRSSLQSSLSTNTTAGTEEENNFSHTLLLKVFLVFQQMQAAGAQPDLACFNVLLYACGRAGDVGRGWDVLRQIQAAGLTPNDRSWRELVRSAGTARQADQAETVWKTGLAYHRHQMRQRTRLVDEPERQWNPSVRTLRCLLQAYLREADGGHAAAKDVDRRRDLYRRVLQSYEDILLGDPRMGMQRIDPMEMLDDQRTILIVLHALVALWSLEEENEGRSSRGDYRIADQDNRKELYSTGRTLLQLECLHQDQLLSPTSLRLVETITSWKLDD